MLKEHVDVFNDTLIRCFVYFQNVRFRYERKAKKKIFFKNCSGDKGYSNSEGSVKMYWKM